MAEEIGFRGEALRINNQQMQPIRQGGGGDTNGGTSATFLGGDSSILAPSTTGIAAPSANGPTNSQQYNVQKASTILSTKDCSQKDRSSGLPYKDREERVRQMRERQQNERQQKLEELKEQAAAAQRFREQQESVRRLRLEEMRSKDSERRTQVEERKRLIQQAEQERREAVLRKSAEREQRLDLKRRQERSNAVFAFGSSTPRMLDPKESSSYFGGRRATSTTNVNLSDSSSAIRPSESQEPTDLSRKRATSAHSLIRKPEGDDTSTRPFAAPPPTAARRRTDLLPTFPSLRDTNSSSRGSPRHRSPGRAHSLGRLDQLARPRPQRPPSLAPLHETSSSRVKSMKPARTMSKSMSHLGPQRARTPIGPATDGVGVPVAEGSLDRRSSRSSLALSHPRMTRAEKLRLSKLRGGSIDAAGIRSGAATPGSPSRPTSSLSQSSGGNSQVMIRSRASPKKPRPLSIAGSTLSSADNPRESASAAAPPAAPASPNRESRSIDRKSSTGSITSKPARAKSVGSDRSTPSTPAKSRGTTPKRTPAQVKAESAARKASERSKGTKPRSTPKTTPLQSPSVESKSVVGVEKSVPKSKPSKEIKLKETENEKDESPKEVVMAEEQQPTVEVNNEAVIKVEDKLVTEDVTLTQKPEDIKDEQTKDEEKENVAPVESADAITNKPIEAAETIQSKSAEVAESTPSKSMEVAQVTPTAPVEAAQPTPSVLVETDQAAPSVPVETAEATNVPVKAVEAEVKEEISEEKEQQQVQRAAEKPVTGYASEEDYKAALAEKRRQVREAKEREIELERQRQLEEEEKERREEEEYLKLMEDQKNAEEERLRKAIEEAERQRVEDAIRKEEEEKQRIEVEKIELQKKLEAEEKMKKEEEERQMRKSRVAAIMSRTRGKGPAPSTPNKNEAKTPSDDSKNLNDALMSSSMTENLLNTISSSMSDSMIVQAIETQSQRILPSSGQSLEEELPVSSASSQPPSDISSQPLSDLSSQPLSDVSNQADSPTSVESSSQLLIDTHVESQTGEGTTTPTLTESRVVVEGNLRGTDNHEELLPDTAPVNLLEAQVNGSPLVPMDTTPTTHSVDLLGSFSGVNGINHNGVASVNFQSTERPDNQFGSLDPFSTPQTLLTTETKTETTFDQIIDLNQTKLTNEDAVNSNPPPPPIIAFEDNLNKKSQQTQETSSNVPDLLL